MRGGGGGGLTSTVLGDFNNSAHLTLGTQASYDTGIVVPDDSHWLLFEFPFWGSGLEQPGWQTNWVKSSDFRSLPAVVASSALGSGNTIISFILWTAPTTTVRVYIRRSATNSIIVAFYNWRTAADVRLRVHSF